MTSACLATVAVAGDVSVDWLHETTEVSAGAPYSWQRAPGSRWSAVPGGAALLARMLKSRFADTHVRLIRPGGHASPIWDPAAIRNIQPEALLQSYARIDLYSRLGDGAREDKKVRRVRRFGGYDGPTDNEKPLPIFGIENDAGQPVNWASLEKARPAVIALDDAGARFRQSDCVNAAIDAASRGGEATWLVLKVSEPLKGNQLLAAVSSRHPEMLPRTTLVITGRTLRSEGVPISRRLSWDRTLADIVSAFVGSKYPIIAQLAKFREIVILLASDAAIVRSEGRVTLVFDASRAEGDFAELCGAQMPGGTTGFVAALVADMALNGMPNHTASVSRVKEALQRARLWLMYGFVDSDSVSSGKLDFPVQEVFGKTPCHYSHSTSLGIGRRELTDEYLTFADFTMKEPRRSKRVGFSILESAINKSGADRMHEFCLEILRTGQLKGMPCARIGSLRCYDPREAESYRAIANVMTAYRSRVFGDGVRRSDIPKPISFAVFGPPGAGKSRGVREIAEQIFGRRATMLTFNLSQFSSPEELAPTFHRIRDIYLSGGLPFVLFDEFDTRLGGDDLGWLRHFLAPMNDGEFLERGHVHPIGAAIFVFAGGTRMSLRDFERNPTAQSTTKGRDYDLLFRQSKGPDFVSRLRGHVDLLGINPPDSRTVRDRLWMIRRAMVLQSSIIRLAPGLVVEKNIRLEAIDPAVLRALLMVARYNHGARSLGAVIEMSSIANQDRFTIADLPSEEHLRAHVSEDFIDLLRSNEIRGAAGIRNRPRRRPRRTA